MMKILSMIKYDLIKYSRERTALIFTLLMPIMMIAIFATINFSPNGQKIPVAIANLDAGEASKNLLNELAKNDTIKVTEYSEQDLYNQVKDSNVELGFVIPQNYTENFQDGRKNEISIVKLPSSTGYAALEDIVRTADLKLSMAQISDQYVEEKLQQHGISVNQTISAKVRNMINSNLDKNPLISVNTEAPNSEQQNANQLASMSLGFIVFFVMFTVIFSSGQILEEKKNNTWDRLSTTLITPFEILVGKVSSAFARGWVQIIILVFVGMWLAKLNFGPSPFIAILVLSIYLLCITGLGLLLATTVKTNAQLGVTASIAIVCSSMLAGCYWPLDIVPNAMQQIAKIFPQYWALKSLRGLVAGYGGIEFIVIPVLVMTLMGTAFFVVALRKGLR